MSDVYIPQDMDYPALEVNVNRERASELGLSPKEVIDNLITSLTSDVMIAPSYWVDPKSGNNYFVTVQYPENQVKSIEDLKAMPLRAPNLNMPTYLNQVADVTPILTPTEVDHYQLQRTIDVYVAPSGEDLGKPAKEISKIIAQTHITAQHAHRRPRAGGDHAILVPQFRTGALAGGSAGLPDSGRAVLFVRGSVPDRARGSHGSDRRDATLAFTGTTLNIQSLMGVVMLQGMVVSNSILIVDFANVLRSEGRSVARGRGRTPAASGCGPF